MLKIAGLLAGLAVLVLLACFVWLTWIDHA